MAPPVGAVQPRVNPFVVTSDVLGDVGVPGQVFTLFCNGLVVRYFGPPEQLVLL